MRRRAERAVEDAPRRLGRVAERGVATSEEGDCADCAWEVDIGRGAFAPGVGGGAIEGDCIGGEGWDWLVG